MPEDDLQAPPGQDDGLTEFDPQQDPDPNVDPANDPDPNTDPANDPPPTPAAPQRNRVAPSFESRGMSAEQRADLAARIFEDPIGVLDSYIDFRDRQRDNSEAATAFHYRDYQKRAPEFFAENEPAIRKAMTLLKPEQRGDPNAVGYAILHAVGQDAEANGGDVIAAIVRAGKQLEGAKPAVAPKRAPDAPSARTPSGGSTRPNPGSGRAPARGASTPASVETRLAASFGKGAARELMTLEDDN
jgi:hypothetical protein